TSAPFLSPTTIFQIFLGKMKIAVSLLSLATVTLMVVAQEEGTAAYYYGLSDEAFDAIVDQKFAELSPEAREFESKVEDAFDMCNGDSGNTEIIGLVSESQQSGLYKEVAIVLVALGRNKLRSE
ncbi:hypothetical protein PENTCL1PPCAC_11834, partial [Pristionchus entomophagus]